MAYIGKEPIVGNFQVCDAISVVNGQAAYTLQVSSTNVIPESANHMLVSLNGILQKPGSSFTISGSTMTFASNLATGDVIDFVQILGNVLDIGQPSDDTVKTASLQANAVTAAKINNDIISGSTELASEPADTDEFLVSDAGVLKRIDASLIGGGGFQSIQTFSSNGTYTKPTGIKKLKVYVTGSGAGGSGANSDSDYGGGGGAGGTAIEVLDATSINTVTVTVGTGGAGVTGDHHGNAGATSSFGSYLSASGGGVGRHGNAGHVFGGLGATVLNYRCGVANSAADS